MLGRAIESALVQTYEPIELIIVDDGSEEDIEAVVDQFDDSRLRFIRHEENQGQAAAENTGIWASEGEYVAFLDSDVEWLPRKIERQVETIRDASDMVGAVHCGYYNEVDGYLKQGTASDCRGDVYIPLLAGDIQITTAKLLVKRTCFEKCGMWDTDLPSYIDYDLCLRLAQEFKFEVVEEPLLISHDHSKPRISTDLDAKRAGLERMIEKWGEEMEAQLGAGALAELKRTQWSVIYQTAATWDVRNGRRVRGAKRYLKHVRRERGVDPKDLALFCLSMLGNGVHEFTKRAWFRVSGEKRSNALDS